MKQCFEEKQVSLLHGVTSSGKTEIYVKLMEESLAAGKQVLYLLPEIALTAQIIRRLQKHFGGQIGIYHSRFSNNERVEIWNKVKSGEIRIVLGARSSLLLPFRDLGLIILDEEHDGSFKQQDPAPRYHARDAAIYYAALFKAKVLLGSATPSLESYFNAKQGKYGLVELQERFGGIAMPEIEIVDVVSEGRSGVTPGLSGAPQLEQKRLFSALRLPHLVHTRADMDGSSCRGCPPGAWDAYGSENPPPVPEVDGCPKPMPPDCAGSTDGAP